MIHDGHRARHKKRFLGSPESFQDHELLEALLFYSIPRRNTNEQAHYLLKDFKNIRNVFDANASALKKVNGIGENSATLIRIVSEIISRYERSDPTFEQSPLESYENLSKFVTSLFVGTDIEKCYIVLFDYSKRVIATHMLSSGDSNGTAIPMQKLAELVSDRRVAAVILAHNHPNGKTIPSGEDIAVTNSIKAFLRPLQIDLLEHFIVVGNDCAPIINYSKRFKISDGE